MTGADRQEVQPHAARTGLDRIREHPVPAQLADAGAAQRVIRQHTRHGDAMTQLGQRHSDVGLGAADVSVQQRSLQEQLARRRGKPQQNLAEADDARRTCVSISQHRQSAWPQSSTD